MLLSSAVRDLFFYFYFRLLLVVILCVCVCEYVFGCWLCVCLRIFAAPYYSAFPVLPLSCFSASLKLFVYYVACTN